MTTAESHARKPASSPGKPVLIGRLPAAAGPRSATSPPNATAPCIACANALAAIPTCPKPLAGSFQRWNAATALYAAELLAERFPIHHSNALQQIDWPGRWQRIPLSDKTLILDASHNPEGCQQLGENLAALGQKPIIVAGTLGEDRALSLMQTIAPFTRELHLVEPNQPRATASHFLERCLPESRDFAVHHRSLADILPAPQTCTVGDAGDTIVLTGSLYLIGEALERLNTESSHPLGHLQDKV